MSDLILIIHALITLLFLLFSLFASYYTGKLAFSHTMKQLRQNGVITLLMLGGIIGLAIIKLSLLISEYVRKISSFSDNLLLCISLIILPAAAIVVYSIPRLFAIIRLQSSDYKIANRTKRRKASEVKLVVPIHALKFGALLYAIPNLYRLPLTLHTELIVACILLIFITPLLMWSQHRRRSRIHRDEGTSIFHLFRRIGVYVTASLLILLTFTHTVTDLIGFSSSEHWSMTVEGTELAPKQPEYKWMNKTLIPVYEGVTLALRVYREKDNR